MGVLKKSLFHSLIYMKQVIFAVKILMPDILIVQFLFQKNNFKK